jgi:hypothetical protein
MTTQTEISHRNHRRAVQFFWVLLVGTAIVSVSGNIAHAVLPYIPHVVIQAGAAAVPPIALLAAVHGIALAVRAGASGTVYRWAVAAVALIGAGAFALSFLALRDLMRAIGYSPATACVFPAIIDTAVAVSTMISRTSTTPATAQSPAARPPSERRMQGAKSHVTPGLPTNLGVQAVRHFRTQDSASVHTHTAQSAHSETVQTEADLAADLIASGATTQSIETVISVLSSHRDGASINAAAKALGINYRTAQRIVEAAERRRRQLTTMVG